MKFSDPSPEAAALGPARVHFHVVPKDPRDAVSWQFSPQRSQREIASRYAMPLGTIRTRIAPGIQKLVRPVCSVTWPDPSDFPPAA